MVEPLEIIARYYEPSTPLWEILTVHSSAVAKLAVEIVRQHPELGADERFVYEGAMLHDIGIIKTEAPSIHCHGTFDYICHGTQGGIMLREIGLEKHALVCERHTGAGITAEEVVKLGLPIEVRDYLPVTVEEEIICYADKFFSKSKKLDEQKTLERAIKSVSKYGDAPYARFMAMHEKYAIASIN